MVDDPLNRDTPREDTNPRDHAKNRDPYVFKPAEWFFKEVQYGATQPNTVSYHEADQKMGDAPNPVCSHGRIFRFDDDIGYLLIQFMRPRVWRIRFHTSNKSATDFTDFNTRTIVQDTLTKMIQVLDIAEQVKWQVEIHEHGTQYYVLQSVLDPDTNPRIAVQLWIRRNPFRITALRSIAAAGVASPLPSFPYSANSITGPFRKFDGPANGQIAIVWQTKDRPLQWHGNATILSIEKAHTARFAGFGEQGGEKMFKDKTCMNYFNFDNMRYFNIYDKGAREDAEPLYHSEPYWIEMNAHPGFKSQVATFIDNYSQVCVDLGLTDHSMLRIATRFNSFQAIFMAGDDVGHIIRSYTSIIGRPSLKPRFILGNHQGCYGYENRWDVIRAVDQYRKYDIPLDGMHVDVDVQRDYRTFTIDTSEHKFPNPETMFSELRDKGVKCSTNITPVINARPDAQYTTLNEGLKNDYFVKDERDIDPSAQSAWDQRYIDFGKGNRYFRDPNDMGHRPQYSVPDDYSFDQNFNSGKPFRGGVDYDEGRGAPGHYPNLNKREVRHWWGKQYEYLFNSGLEFVWQDMTSPCMARAYGDMRSWPFRLLLDSDGWSGDSKAADQRKQKAIEIWSLYSYNLHKATFHGLSKLKAREGRRNFIIGRGSFAGAQRYAGLWTGDNVSNWEFLDISVSQVLALGLAGVTIAGADVGGFEPNDGENDFADPELLIRWYSAYSLLPWFRNHYSAKKSIKGSAFDKKKFQEPYAYREFQDSPGWGRIPEADRVMYYSVLPACRYIIQLRYSLMQLMYDAMFENMINGLPIARAMIITDPLDASLYQANQLYTRSQYLLRQDLLVAPALYKQSKREKRKLYLPYPDDWYPMNLRPENNNLGMPLRPKIGGGSYIEYDCRIGPNEDRLPYITPMYIREGGIIPQMEYRAYVPDWKRKTESVNPITLNVYPGKDNVYDMYLDDGVSRESAPSNVYLSALEDSNGEQAMTLVDAYGDKEAQSIFRHVRIEQKTTRVFAPDRLRDFRRVSIKTLHDLYTDANVMRDNGPEYRVVFWHAARWPDKDFNMTDVNVNVSGTDRSRWDHNWDLRATIVWVPTNADVSSVIEVSHPA